MPISDVIVALQGFAGAYGKIASRIDPHHHHEIRVAEINSIRQSKPRVDERVINVLPRRRV
jgi:hypothetical protein